MFGLKLVNKQRYENLLDTEKKWNCLVSIADNSRLMPLKSLLIDVEYTSAKNAALNFVRGAAFFNWRSKENFVMKN